MNQEEELKKIVEFQLKILEGMTALAENLKDYQKKQLNINQVILEILKNGK